MTLTSAFDDEMAGLLRQDGGEAESASLSDLGFSDLYLRVDQDAEARYRVGPNERGFHGNLPVPSEYDVELSTLRAMVHRQRLDEGTFLYDRMRLRYRRATCVGAEVWAALRNVPLELPDFDALRLRMAPEAVSTLRSWTTRSGLVLVGGTTGAGKTTTLVAMINDLLSRSSEVAVTIEDPPEYLMQGPLGLGVCFQFEVRQESDWADLVKGALRWRPRVIMIGEIRTPDAAAQALRVSTSGHLVLATVHGGSVEESIASVLRLADVNLKGAGGTMLSDHLIGCVHQRPAKRTMEASTLSAPPVQGQLDNVRRLIAEGRFEKLSDHIVQHRAV